jgi:hypothetical protein
VNLFGQGMRLFDGRVDAKLLRDARAYSLEGGQALHVWQPGPGGWPGQPACFAAEARAGHPWAHLMDQDVDRLTATVKRLGVRVVVVSKRGQPDQHVDLCGGPLREAMAKATDR